jgi:putative PIN family toxin of toxin-antitoxin system
VITAVLDSNVLASGFVGVPRPTSTPGELIRQWRDGRFTLVVSEHLHAEVADTFDDAYFRRRLTDVDRASALTALRRQALTAPITVIVQKVATHPEDDLILAGAVSAKVQYLVTGDTKLQRLGTYERVRIVSPREFLEILAPPG